MQGNFKELARNFKGTCEELFWGTLMELSTNLGGTCEELTGNLLGTL